LFPFAHIYYRLESRDTRCATNVQNQNVEGSCHSVKTSSNCLFIALCTTKLAESNGDVRILTGSSQLAVFAHAQCIFGQNSPDRLVLCRTAFFAMHSQLPHFLVYNTAKFRLSVILRFRTKREQEIMRQTDRQTDGRTDGRTKAALTTLRHGMGGGAPHESTVDTEVCCMSLLSDRPRPRLYTNQCQQRGM